MSALNLKMCRVPKDSRLIIGKFRDAVKYESAHLPIHMQEDLEDDVEDIAEEAKDIEKGSEYYRRKRRSRFRRKAQISIEDSSKKVKDGPSGIKFSGTPIEPKTEGGIASKYCLLQVVKVGNTSEVNVIPIDDWYEFQKVSNI